MTYFERIKQENENYLAGLTAELMTALAAGIVGMSAKEMKHTKKQAKQEVLKLLKTEVPEDVR